MSKWRAIKADAKYLVSDVGTVWSVKTGRVLASSTAGRGYPTVSVSVGGKNRTLKVHRLVAEAFIPNPQGLPQVNHIDGDKTNNHVDNLEWCTNQRNSEHALAKVWVFTSPDGAEVTIYNLNQFCRDHKLHAGCMTEVYYGKLTQHKGWKK